MYLGWLPTACSVASAARFCRAVAGVVRRGAERPRRRQHHRARHPAGMGDAGQQLGRRLRQRHGRVLGVAGLARPAAAGRAPGRPAGSRPAPSITAGCRRSSSAPGSRRTRARLRACPRWLRAQGFDLVDVPRQPPVRDGQRHGGPGRARVPGERVAVQRERADGARARRRPQDPGRPGRERDGDHGPRQRLLAGAAARPRRRRRRRPPARSVGPCSHYWGERTSRRLPQPVRPRHAAAVADLRVHAAADRVGLRDRPAAAAAPGRPRPDDRDHGGVLLADDPRRPQPLLADVRPAARPTTGGGRAGHARSSRSDPADTQEWYIEQALDVEWTHAVAPRAKHRLRRGRERRPRARPGPERGGRQAPGRRRLQQLGHARERSPRRARCMR